MGGQGVLERGHSRLMKNSLLVSVVILVVSACTLATPGATADPKSADDPNGAKDSEIFGVVWKLVEIQLMNGSTMAVENPDKYTFELQPDGKVQIRADCNRGFGSYTLKGRQIVFQPAAYTRAACPPGSLFDVYTRHLQEANAFVVQGGFLDLSYGIDRGIMRFTR